MNSGNKRIIAALLLGSMFSYSPALATTKATVTSNGSSGALVSGNAVVADGTNSVTDSGVVISGVFSATGGLSSPTTLANTDCGKGYVAGVTYTAINLPASPSKNCTYKFTMGVAGFYVNFNGQHANIPGVSVDVTQYTLASPSAYRTNYAAYILRYNGTFWEMDPPSSPAAAANLRASNASPYAHGQFYLTHDAGNSIFKACPVNGEGVVVDGTMWALTPDCLTEQDSDTTNSTTNYFYFVKTAAESDVAVTGAVDSATTPGKIRLTFGVSLLGNVNDIIRLRCVNIGGAIQANVSDAAKIIDATHADFLNTSSSGLGTYSSPGSCQVLRLDSSTTSHAQQPSDGTEVKNDDNHYAYAGSAVIGGAHSVTSWTSWLNWQMAVTGALKSNGSGVVSQAAASDLSDGTTGSGAVVQATSPTVSGATLSGTTTVTGHQVSNGTALACADLAFGTGAGTSPTCTSVTGDDRRYRVSFSTGTAPATGGVILTVTFKSAYGATPFCAMAPENSPGAAKINALFLTPTTTTLALALTGVGVLVASTAYVFTFQCLG